MGRGGVKRLFALPRRRRVQSGQGRRLVVPADVEGVGVVPSYNVGTDDFSKREVVESCLEARNILHPSRILGITREQARHLLIEYDLADGGGGYAASIPPKSELPNPEDLVDGGSG